MGKREKVLVLYLGGVIVSLLTVGLVSATPVRHLIQIIPAALAVVALMKRTPWAPHAALSVFVFWFVIVVFIWLWLLGIARIITGHFTRTEVALTLAIGIFCVGGVRAAASVSSRATAAARWLASVLFGALQVAAMWTSLLPAVSSR